MNFKLTQDVVDRFESKVNRSGGPSACHIYQAAKHKNGYGQFFLGRVEGKKKHILAHRFAWWLAHGSLPDAGLQVRHYVCGNRACCNPAHLRIGTSADNHADMVRDGTSTKGERNARAKLNAEAALAIRESTDNVQELARRHGVSDTTVYLIQRGLHWAHVGGRKGERPKKRIPRGEQTGHAKITADDVRSIRDRYAAGLVTQRQLAKEFGLNQASISDIINYKRWSHIP